MVKNKSGRPIGRPNTMSRLISNLKLGVESNKHGEEFLGFCVNELASKDMRSIRFVLCDLLIAGLQSSERYKGEYENLKAAYEQQCSVTAQEG